MRQSLPWLVLCVAVACGGGSSGSSAPDSGGSGDAGSQDDANPVDGAPSDATQSDATRVDAAAPGDAADEDSAPLDAAGVEDSAQAHDARADGAPSTGDAATCTDPCPAPHGGVTLGCEKRFWYGENYAWKNFSTDFGGLATWNQVGVAAAPSGYLTDLQTMKADGANVIRWWIFPDLRGDGVKLDAGGVPSGLGSTVLADVTEALDLADQAGVFLQLTFFSFDAFNPTTVTDGVTIPCIVPIATSAQSTTQLVTNVVQPVVHAATASAHADRIAAWEVINEPEWAITGSDPYGDPAFTPTSGLTTVTFAQMQTFVNAVVAGITAETSAYVTVGGAAPKWAKAWTHSSLTLYEWHYYDWINEYWPYTDGPSTYGITLPLVVGELPNSGFTMPSTASYPTVMSAFYGNGYAGAMGWALTDTSFGSPSTLQSFETANACTTQFTLPQAAEMVRPGAKPTASTVHPSARRCTTAANGVPVCW
jgi:hypothetical protein